MAVARAATASDAARRSPPAALLSIAFALLLGFQAIRVFTTHTVWLIGETSSREVLGIVVLGGFAAAILGWPLIRAFGNQAASLWSLRLLAAAAAVGQISAVPGVDFAAGLVGTIALGWFLAFLPALGSAAPMALALALALDLTVRIGFITIDAPFAHHPAASAVVAIAVAIVALGAPSIARQAKQLPGWRNAWPLIGLGPGLVAFLILSGNLGQVMVGADLDFRAAGLALAIGAAVGIVWTSALIRVGPAHRRILLGVAAVVLVAGFVLFDARSPAAGLGAAAVAAALPVVLVPMVQRSDGSNRVAPTVVSVTIGLLLLVVLLFVFYSFYGPDWVLWAAVIATALVGVGGSLKRPPEVEDERRARRRPWPAPIVAAGLVLLPAVAVAGTAAPPDAGFAESDGLRVVTYNIRQGFGVEGRFDLEAVAQTLENDAADVIALQEVGRGWVISGAADTLTWLSQRLDMPYVYGAGAGDLWGNAVLTRLPVQSTVHHFDNPGRIPRGALELAIDAHGMTYTLINTHLDHDDDGGPTREDQARSLLDIWGGRSHTLLVGDLNAEADARSMQLAFRAGFLDPDAGGPPTFPADAERIDYVLHTPDLSVVEVRRPITAASDHEPVWVKLAPHTLAAVVPR
ncbi:MAG: endonuclease/exonuclease/phosphatase family protein [Chloroflexota bacterium]|nr:endonuclease/exonuclease/phosphatase family protein [Chloroflexota bacterium]